MPILLHLLGTATGQQAVYQNQLTLTVDYQQPGLAVAPSAVWFECTAVAGSSALPPQSDSVYDARYHEIIYHWSFDDETFAAPSSALNAPDFWKDTNTARGKRVAHCFNDPGTYTVTCTAYEPSTRRFGEATIEITVEDPATAFPNERTIVYAPNGTAGLTIPDYANVQATWAGCQAARDVLGTNLTGRILIAPGVNLTLTASDANITAGSWSNCRIGALDPTGARSSIVASGREGAGQMDALIRDRSELCVECVLYDLDFVGEWDAASETGRVLYPFSINKSSYNFAEHLFALHQCNVSGFSQVRGHFAMQDGGYAYAMYSNTMVTNWQDYGITSGIVTQPRMDTALVGSSIVQHPEALSGGSKNGLYNNHGALRDFASNNLFISVSDLFSRSGWSSGGTLNGDSVTSDNSTLRINTRGEPGKASCLDRVTIEGTVQLVEQDRFNVDVPGNHLMDKVLLVGGSRATYAYLLTSRYGGTTLRNIVGVKLGLPEASDSLQMEEFISFNNEDGTAENDPAGVRVFGSTFIDLRTDAQADDKEVLGVRQRDVPFNNFAFEHNLIHEPNRSASVQQGGVNEDVLQETIGFLPRHKGPRYGFRHVSGTFSLDIDVGFGFDVAYTEFPDRAVADTTSQTIDQTYWQDNEATDIRHALRIDGETYHAELGHFYVSFGSDRVTITNTSGEQWPAAASWDLRLDRSSRLPNFNPIYDSLAAWSNASIVATDPDSGTLIEGGLRRYDDFCGKVIPVGAIRKGAVT